MASRRASASGPHGAGERDPAPRALHLDRARDLPGVDRLARLAARLLGSPMAAVTVVADEGAVTLGSVGFDALAFEAAFSRHTMLAAPDPIVVPDLAADPRFADAVGAEPTVRAAVGAPLLLADGRPIGSLAVYDVAPRTPTLEEIDALRDLAVLAVEALDLHSLRHQLDEAKDDARRLATTDALTGLSNRRTLDDRLDRAVALARRTRHALAVLMIGVEGLAEVRERDGPERADAVVVELAERLASGVREHDLVARHGEEAFTVVLQAVDRAAVAEAAGRLHEALTVEIAVDGADGGVRARVSIGVALHPTDGEDMASLLRAAELAMHQAMEATGGVRRYSPD